MLNQRNSRHGVEFPYHSDASVRELQRGAYRALTLADDSLGQLLDYLCTNKLEQNTMIVFTSDNGFMYGDHGLIDKRTAYQPSVRVPLLVYAPRILPILPKGTVNKAVVRNLDFAPTFLDVAKVPKPRQMEGDSWLPLIDWKTLLPAARTRLRNRPACSLLPPPSAQGSALPRVQTITTYLQVTGSSDRR